MSDAVQCNALVWVLVVWALAIIAGVPAEVTAVPGLLCEGLAVWLYIKGTRWR